MRRTWLCLALVACALLALVALGVLPLPIAGFARDRLAPRETTSGPGTPDAGAPTLDGAAEHPSLLAAPAGEVVPIPANPPAAEAVRGTDPRGAWVGGRLVRAGHPPTPVAGAHVSLRRVHALAGLLRVAPAGRWDDLETVSGADGRFAFRDVRPASPVRLGVRAEGVVLLGPVALDLSQGQRRDLGDLALGEGGSVEGLVVDRDGHPIVGARVVAFDASGEIRGERAHGDGPDEVRLSPADPAFAPEPEASSVTDAEGRYRLDALPPGWKVVTAQGPDGRADDGLEEVRAGGTTVAEDLQLRRAGRLAGRVVLPDGRGAGGALVLAATSLRGQVHRAICDEAGAFALDALSGRTARILVRVPSGAALLTQLDLPTADALLRLAEPSWVRARLESTAPAVRLVGVRALLAPDRPPEGASETERAAGLVAELLAGALGTEPLDAPDGALSLVVPLPGRYRLAVSAEGHSLHVTEPFAVEAGQSVELGRVPLTPLRTLTGRVTVGGRPAPMPVHVLFLAGEERANDETLLRAWASQFLASGSATPLRSGDASLPDGWTDEEGRFVLELEWQGPGLLVLRGDGLAPELRWIDASAGAAGPLAVPLHAGAALRLHVVESDGEPASGVSVWMARPTGELCQTATEASGEVLFRALPPGPVALLVVRPAHQAVNERLFAHYLRNAGRRLESSWAPYEAVAEAGEVLDLVAGAVREHTLRLPRRCAVTVRARNSDEPIEGLASVHASIPVSKPAIGWYANFERDPADPRADLRLRLEPGVYELRIYVEDEETVVLPAVAIPDQPTFVVRLP